MALQSAASIQFISLERDNVSGEKLEGVPASQCDYKLLSEIQTDLLGLHQHYVDTMGQPPQTFNGGKHVLSGEDVEMISDSEGDGIVLDVEVPRTSPDFRGKYDVRLLAVRFFAVGAETSDDRLEVTLTHTGAEVFVDGSNRGARFTHHPVKVTFKYVLSDSTYKGPETTDGVISSDIDDVYARVGPFTRWRIEIRKENNRDLNLKPVTSAYLEFDFKYRTL